MRDLFSFCEKMLGELVNWFKNNEEKSSFQDKDLIEIVNVLFFFILGIGCCFDL
jgi:hypothetical protein